MRNLEKEIDTIVHKIHDKEPFHIQIPVKNKLVFSKVVPYIFVYRSQGKVSTILSDIAKSAYAYLIVKDPSLDVTDLVTAVAQKLVEEFGACLVVEAWTAAENQVEDLQICISRKQVLQVAQYLGKQLHNEENTLLVDIVSKSKLAVPEGKKALFDVQDKRNAGIFFIGLQLRENWWMDEHRKIIPTAMRHLRDGLSRSLSKTFFEFIRIHTSFQPTSFKVHRKKELAPLVWQIDQQLANESRRFDFLLLVTPMNAHEAWLQFKKDNFRKAPVFRYRPIPIDPDIVKRNLYNLPIEDLSDPTLAYLFRDKRKELDYMLNMLRERGREGFLHGSLQVFGHVSERLLDKAKAILTITNEESGAIYKDDDLVSAEEFAAIAKQELAILKGQDPNFDTTVRLRDDIYGVMVNQGVLNISKHYTVSRNRVNALIQHEVGTHIVTYYNGKQQPFHLFKLGVPGYEKLQEGLAVLSEYMIGELTSDRLRILAARVVAVAHMSLGNTFIDTFFLLNEHYRFDSKTAYQIAMRVYRAGGLTKDALYLKGLIELINYVKAGKDIDLLLMGKIREDYIPIVQELMIKGLLRAPILKPRYLQQPYLDRLSHLKEQKGIFQMIL